MIAMVNGYPTVEELRNRILRQLEWRGPTTEVASVWRGYLTALLEWGLLEISDHDTLASLLPFKGVKEVVELSADEPLDKESNDYIDEKMKLDAARWK
ncbi:hypothetical protein J6337_04185 [Burkholderia pseudomallei]|uniref:hypothetical protein n=1 Tax=Burkholderia pseudomallei TaxID=28450 RepID=UPI001AAEF1CB|nr:hypothetical protein [Burkholderia pseudomallei]MBO3051938.1 hypothetical protein [Burkholderia pseudomallei]MBO7750864.1 hypothetical protein [Burkholderia pseudomallei]MBO7802627.1 hypothetical protein [Burkholderia pseudomallei]MBO7862205.1 hypothetical protein [Burkholderia pseudomallei]MBO7874008.1 hypothetical protein [Burkholderia pseudomallei]